MRFSYAYEIRMWKLTKTIYLFAVTVSKRLMARYGSIIDGKGCRWTNSASLDIVPRMLSLTRTIPILVLFIVGCTGVQTIKSGKDALGEQTQIDDRLHEILDAAQKKDFPRLDSYHLYGPKFTKFPTEGGRLGSDRAREEEHRGLSMIANLSMQPDDLKIDVFGDVAIATFIMNSSFDAGTNRVQRMARSTLVFVRDGGAWKIAHEHFSPFSSRP